MKIRINYLQMRNDNLMVNPLAVYISQLGKQKERRCQNFKFLFWTIGTSSGNKD